MCFSAQFLTSGASKRSKGVHWQGPLKIIHHVSVATAVFEINPPQKMYQLGLGNIWAENNEIHRDCLLPRDHRTHWYSFPFLSISGAASSSLGFSARLIFSVYFHFKKKNISPFHPSLCLLVSLCLCLPLSIRVSPVRVRVCASSLPASRVVALSAAPSLPFITLYYHTRTARVFSSSHRLWIITVLFFHHAGGGR